MSNSIKFSIFSAILFACTFGSYAQQAELPNDTIYNPEIIYSPIPHTYEIGGITVSGVKNVDDYVIIGYSGLSVGEKIEIPGDAITNAVKRFWRQGLY
ncbi:MAG: outer membrane protein assembly factor BamA, partial [Muribaculaceae bacterium]|nr:outer membrane protein assembly factor BamA [Muribaculaceae bacterium]